MKHSTPRYVLGAFVIAGCAVLLTAQEPQMPVATPAPAEPPPGAGNGPHPGPAADAKAGARTSGVAPAAPHYDPAARMADYLGIGAPPNKEAAARGQKIFVASCGFCHGSTANGGATGPDLVRSVLVLHDHGTGKEIAPVVLNGRPARGMPSFNMSTEQIQDIAQFLLGRTQAAANRSNYKILNVVTGDSKAGEAYFGSHCGSCHSPTGDLAHIAGRFDPATLQSRFLYPRRRRFPGMQARSSKADTTVTVTLRSGQSFTGRLDYLDDFAVSLTDSSGEHHSWNLDDETGVKVQVHNPLEAHAELLPRYTDADMHNVLAYLETLK